MQNRTAREGEPGAPPEHHLDSLNEPWGSEVIPPVDTDGGEGGGEESGEAPVITLLEPATCAIGDPDFTMYVHGTGFTADSIIHFAGYDEPTTYNDVDGSLSTGIKPSLWGAPDTVQVSVKNGAQVSEEVDFFFT
jgi:hypothetical protein